MYSNWTSPVFLRMIQRWLLSFGGGGVIYLHVLLFKLSCSNLGAVGQTLLVTNWMYFFFTVISMSSLLVTHPSRSPRCCAMCSTQHLVLWPPRGVDPQGWVLLLQWPQTKRQVSPYSTVLFHSPDSYYNVNWFKCFNYLKHFNVEHACTVKVELFLERVKFSIINFIWVYF